MLPGAVRQAPFDSERVASFIVCDGLGFFLENGRPPFLADWPELLGGYVLSRVPRYRAEQIAGELGEVFESPEPFVAAAHLSHSLGCAAS